MSPVLFVNLPVRDLDRSKTFFTDLGFTLFGMADDMASVVINEQAQVMLLTEPTYATYAATDVADATKSSQMILVVGVENPTEVDELFDKALAAGGAPVGDLRNDGYRYQRGFTDLDGHHWEALCLVTPAG
ncbi:VOC family protein [Sphaerisporangium corydalis]|uniref:VOC family protein n=1 Tax=Sphaerisporangium corydalis TaxID=1441875 RepID=A0ABV9EFM1_9ACTN|nr:VOC family protein [Sphaerisporangium corydalis]